MYKNCFDLQIKYSKQEIKNLPGYCLKQGTFLVTIMNNIQTDPQTKRYRNKYKYLKMRIRSLILENAALCDEVAKIQESIVIVKDERKFLLHKLLECENEADIAQVYHRNEPVTMNGSKSKMKKRHSLEDSK